MTNYSARLAGCYARAHYVGWSVALGSAFALVFAFLAPETLPVLLLNDDIRLRSVNLLGVLVAVAVGASFRITVSEYELAFRSALRLLRAQHVAVACAPFVVLALATAYTTGSGWSGVDGGMNGLAFLGLVLAVPIAVPLPGWLAPAAVATVSYLLGPNPATGKARVWAWLLWSHSAEKYLIDGAIFAVGALLWLFVYDRMDGSESF